MGTDRYPIARERIVKNFKSINKFCEKTKIPKASVIRVIQGKYGSGDTNDSNQRDRIEQAMLAHGVSHEDLRNMWAEIHQKGGSAIVHISGRKLRITYTIVLEDLGDAVR